MSDLNKTVFHERHAQAGAKMVDFAGWLMPVQYSGGIIAEHLATRRNAGLFDVSHMGRFIFRGEGALDFLQHVLTNNAAALELGQAQYTIIPNQAGGAIDDAYLYRFCEDEYLLVVNASNRLKDWDHFQSLTGDYDVEMTDKTFDIAMVCLQGSAGKEILLKLLDSPVLPDPKRNELMVSSIGGKEVLIGRTGYTGEPICFELFIDVGDAIAIWDGLVQAGAAPIGLGARDTLRLEASLPLYGHELGIDPEGNEIPVFAIGLAKFAVSFSPLKGDYVGKSELEKQYHAMERIADGDYSLTDDLPRMVMPVVITGRAIARPGAKVFADGEGEKLLGYVTSGTMVPYWQTQGHGLESKLTDTQQLRAIALALLDSSLRPDDQVFVEIRKKLTAAVIVPYHMRSEAAPLARPIVHKPKAQPEPADQTDADKVASLLTKAAENTVWRQQKCINLIPSEMTASPMVRLLSIMDPAFRYAEHKPVKAFKDAEVFYYQGVGFIEQVEQLLQVEMCKFLGCAETETRAVSGQMANAVVFSAMVDYLNRSRRKFEPRRMRKVFNNSIIRGGHLSSQPMGALRDFVAHDPQTERPAVVNFPVLEDNPYKIDVAACGQLLDEHRPELIIFGKSAVLHTEPVAEIRKMVDDLGINTVIMYDMAHVLGLVGEHFQQPFAEGADIVTGSTHKTFFGTQRGVIGANFSEGEIKYDLWEAIGRRTFPGAVSNHHLGTLLGLLMAAYEMNHFKDEYQRAVLGNARAFAAALNDAGLEVAGDAAGGYTQTHQVIINVGYARGPELANRLEANNIVVNYQAAPNEEGFSAAGSIRMGVSEMTRFGMGTEDFAQLAQLIRDVIVEDKQITGEVESFRQKFTELQYCFSDDQYDGAVERLHSLI